VVSVREQKSKLLILSTFIIFSIFLTGCGGTIQSGGRTKNFIGIPTPFKRIVLPSSPYGPEGKAPPIKKNFTPEERCHNNLKNIGFALELYAVNHQGKYPSSLSQLDKEILKSIPTEPVTGKSYLYS